VQFVNFKNQLPFLAPVSDQIYFEVMKLKHISGWTEPMKQHTVSCVYGVCKVWLVWRTTSLTNAASNKSSHLLPVYGRSEVPPGTEGPAVLCKEYCMENAIKMHRQIKLQVTVMPRIVNAVQRTIPANGDGRLTRHLHFSWQKNDFNSFRMIEDQDIAPECECVWFNVPLDT